jgi:hypothetical protein
MKTKNEKTRAEFDGLPQRNHVFAPGDKVLVYRLGFCMRPFIEGEAGIIDPVPGASGLYRVKFRHERLPVVRLVHEGAWQSHPERLVADLMAHWRATIAPETLGPSIAEISEFGAGMLRKH